MQKTQGTYPYVPTGGTCHADGQHEPQQEDEAQRPFDRCDHRHIGTKRRILSEKSRVKGVQYLKFRCVLGSYGTAKYYAE
jgi:hypothetical protein